LAERILYLMARSNSKSEFAERINWPIWLWLFVAMMIASLYLTIWAPFNTMTAVIICLLTSLAIFYSSQKTRLEIVVSYVVCRQIQPVLMQLGFGYLPVLRLKLWINQIQLRIG